jgi:sugar lactone lactonase YvrE
MKSLKTISIVLFAFCVVSFASAQKPTLTKIWETDSTLKTPESVLYYAPEKMLYVSCIDGKSDEKDLKGSIAKVSPEGKIIKADWATNLSAPKGMGIHNGSLYVTDLTDVVVIELKSGKITKRIAVPNAIFLNDIAIDSKGIIYVTDTRAGKIYQIRNGEPSLWIDKKPRANGLLTVGNDVYIAVKDTLYKADPDKKLTAITTGMDESSDGIAQTGNDFIVSCWNGVIYYVKPDGSKTELIDTRAQKSNTADIGFDPATKTVYVPTFFKNKVVAYRLK